MHRDSKKLFGLGFAIPWALGLGIGLLQCTDSPPTGGIPTVNDLSQAPPGNGDGGGSSPNDMSVVPADMTVVCQAGQHVDGNSCVCDISSCLCGACIGTTCTPRTIASGQMNPRALAVDNGAVYFANSGGASVQKVNTDGTGITAIDTTVSSPLGLALDVNNIYFSGPMSGTVYRYGRVDMHLYSMATGINVPRAIAVDSSAVYALSVSGGTLSKILIANNMTTTLASGLSSPYGLAVDSSGVYFTTGDGKLNRVGLDGSGLTALATGQTDPRGVALDATSVYWVNHNSGAVYALAKAGGTPRRLGKTTFLEGIALDNTNVYVTSSNGTVLRFSKSLIDQTPIIVASAQGNPYDITVDPQCVYWTNDQAGTVMKGDK